VGGSYAQLQDHAASDKILWKSDDLWTSELRLSFRKRRRSVSCTLNEHIQRNVTCGFCMYIGDTAWNHDSADLHAWRKAKQKLRASARNDNSKYSVKFPKCTYGVAVGPRPIMMPCFGRRPTGHWNYRTNLGREIAIGVAGFTRIQVLTNVSTPCRSCYPTLQGDSGRFSQRQLRCSVGWLYLITGSTRQRKEGLPGSRQGQWPGSRDPVSDWTHAARDSHRDPPDCIVHATTTNIKQLRRNTASHAALVAFFPLSS